MTTNQSSRFGRLLRASATALAVAFVGTGALSPATAQAAGISTGRVPVATDAGRSPSASPSDIPVVLSLGRESTVPSTVGTRDTVFVTVPAARTSRSAGHD